MNIIKKREIEFDIAKAFAIIVMVIAHSVMMFYVGSSNAMDFFYSVISGVYCAPVFMVCMGISIVYSRNNAYKDLFKRGIKILSIALVLELLRNVLPQLIRFYLFATPSWQIALSYFTCVDILAFASMAFILMSLFKRLNLSSIKIFIISIVMVLFASYFSDNVVINNMVLAQILNYFIRINPYSSFPLFTWFIFPAFGVMFGEYILHCKNKDKFYMIITPLTFIPATIYFVLGYFYKFGATGDKYYDMRVLDALISCVLVVGIIGVCYFIKKYLSNVKWHITTNISGNVTAIYCIHWVIISLIYNYSVIKHISIELSEIPVIILGLLIIIISSFISYFYKKIKH